MPKSRPPRPRLAGPAWAAIVARGVAVALAATLATPCVSSAQVDDPDVRFVEAMRGRGYFELTLEYLDRAASDPAVGPALRARVAYERAVTQLAQAASLADSSSRDRQIDAARKTFAEFLAGTQDKALAAEGAARLAAAIAEQGRRGLLQADKRQAATQKSARNRLLQTARQDYDDARRLYGDSTDRYRAVLKELGAPTPRSPEATRRRMLRGQLGSAAVMGARSLHDKAKTYAAGSKNHKRLNAAAAEELAAHADEFYDLIIGLYAGLYEGWCYQARGEHKLALGCFEELIDDRADDPAQREVTTLAYVYLAASHTAEGQPKKALDTAGVWLRGLRAGEMPRAAAALKYQVGAATLALAQAEKNADARRLLNRAQELLREAGRVPGEFQADARRQLAVVNQALGADDEAITTFADAYLIGRDKLGALSVAAMQTGAGGDADQQRAGLRADARRAFQAALRLVDGDVEPKRLNEARYWLGYIYWLDDQPLRAAAIGEFVARTSPDDPSAELAARLALAAHNKLYRQARADGGDAAFAEARLRAAAGFVADQWAGKALADEAFSVLLEVAIASGDLQAAERVLGRLPEDRRAVQGLKLANALWQRGQRLAIEAKDDAAAAADAARVKADARTRLEAGLEAVGTRGAVSPTEATAALLLAQALLEAGDPAAAVKLIEHQRRGPLTLLSQKDPSVDRAGFAAEAYRVALRGYASVSPPRTDAAIGVMAKLEEAVGGDTQLLRRVYFSLGLQLRSQMTSLADAGKPRDAQQLGEAFAVFLDRLSKQAEGADWLTRQWIGQMYLSLGDGLQGGANPADQAGYYRRAADTFAAMIGQAADDASFAPTDNAVLAAKMQLGVAQRGAGDYEAAIGTFASMLADRPVMLDVQKAAAYTYQRWGEQSQDTDRLTTAIRGGRPAPGTGKNVVWGWSKLAGVAGRAARSKPEYKPLFFECWRNVAACRVIAAEQASGPTRDKQLARARKTIRSIVRQYPDGGGAESYRQYDALMRRIQRLEGVEAVGLAELEP